MQNASLGTAPPRAQPINGSPAAFTAADRPAAGRTSHGQGSAMETRSLGEATAGLAAGTGPSPGKKVFIIPASSPPIR